MAQSRCRSIFMSIITLLSSFWCVRAFIDQEGFLVSLAIFLALQLLSYRSRGRSSSSSSTIEMACSSIQSSSSSALMACSSIQSCSSSALMTRKYDVFVSFRGDTRNNFTDHLFGALQRKHIVAFRDDTKIKKGESLAPELLHAIEGSLVYVVVFSENYASSTWCLRELEYILECVRVSRKCVLPIFYDVDPSQVRHQKGKYAEAFAKHEERVKQDLDMVQNWRAALTQVADLSGWDMRHKPQYAEIEKVVEEIINKLGRNFSSFPKDLVGMDSPIQELENLLLLDSVDDIRVVGISGLGGIGKSTLVTVLYGKISHQFDACCFIDDVSKIYRHDGPIGALQQIVHQVLREERHQICNLYDATILIQSRLCHVRALIILDNVDHGGQLEKLALDSERLGAGSRILITSRDEHILKEYGVDVVYKVPLLNHANSLQLFCQKAFKRDNIMSGIMSDYERLANEILDYAGGLPLAIKVLGSFLFGRDISEWRSALARLKESPNNDIMDVLRLSFDGLEKMEKDIFLDIACFFVDDSENYVKHILNCCGFHPDIGLRVLIDKSLISIGGYPERIVQMHGLLQELGKNIVQENSKNNPRKWSRLWLHKDLDIVTRDNMEKNVEAIVLGHPPCKREGEILMGETLSKMSHLRLLILCNGDLLENLDWPFNELRYIHLHDYPFEYLPSSFHPDQLVDLQLQYSKIKQLWKGKKYLPNLRFLDLSHSRNLNTMPDFSEFPNIEQLNLEGCRNLVQLGPSNDVPRKLVFLNLTGCKNLSSIPNNIFGVSSLRDLNISRCFKAVKNLKLFSAFKSMISLPFHSLCELNVSFCGLSQIPDAIGCLHWLERLNLGGNEFVTLPSLEKLSKLVYLNLEHCKQLKSLTELPSPKIPSPASYDYFRIRGMLIFNCPVLGERERCSSMISSWMIQFIWANQQPSAPFRRVDTIIPGSEIPRWFKNQRSGRSRMGMDPSPIMGDNDVIGVAYCVVFLVTPSNKRGFTDLKIHFCPKNYGGYGLYITSPVVLDSDLITVNSTHMWLIYFPLESFLNSIGLSPRNLDELIIDTCMGNPSYVKVMNRGYNWVFKKDLQMKHDENSLAVSHNFLTI